MKDGSFYSALENGRIVKHQVTDGAAVETLFDEGVSVENLGQKITIADYTLSSNEQKILIETDPEQIYRRSSRAENFVYDIKTKKLQSCLLEANNLLQLFARWYKDCVCTSKQPIYG
jgi:dipeptidyl-peptidase-4